VGERNAGSALRKWADMEDTVKNVVVFGAGLVAGAHVRYLLEHGYQVTVASRTVSKARQIVGDHPSGRPVAFDIETEGDARLDEIVREHDLAVSLLPYVYHTRVAKSCLRHRKHMVTTSYVKPEMQALDAEAKSADVVLLNEIGVDPGIDHMTAMKVIHRVKATGGEITRFTSYCGGLPAPEANDNPFGYKFSWSPRGVLMAGRNAARFRQDGDLVEVPGSDLFLHYWCVPIEVEGKIIPFEGYPNRDSMPYAETYGIASTRTMFRGTLRNQGWCPTLKKIAELGLLGEDEMALSDLTYAQFMAKLIGKKSPRGVKQAVARKLGLDPVNFIVANLDWLGLFSSAPLPPGCRSPLDVMTATMLAKMSYAPGERDLLILQHQFVAEFPGRKEKISSTMIDFGIPNGDSSMNRTVGLPAAVGVRLILEGKITSRGVLVPVLPEIYEPALVELERLGIQFSERTEKI
jgi:saccharopine dehydrogenase-like NADP-dependent oxidoreductase